VEATARPVVEVDVVHAATVGADAAAMDLLEPAGDLATGQPAETRYERSDICAVPRAAVVGEAMVAYVLADALLEKLGGDSLAEMRPRYSALRW